MKKKLVASLAAAMVIGVAGTSFAASSNPFVDVPAKHWAYDAVNSLAKAGIIDGTGNGKFDGGSTLTRYEIAQIVAKAMAHSDKADAAQKATIEKLKAEFASELEGLNVRVTNVENKVDNVKWGGEVRERFDRVTPENSDNKYTNSHSYMDLWATAQINPDWVAKAEFENTKAMNNSRIAGVTAGEDTSTNPTTRIYAQGKLFGATATIGKFNPFSGYGLVIDDNMTGAQFEFGNALKARVGYGKYAGGSNAFLANANGTVNSLVRQVGVATYDAGFGSVAPAYAFGELDYAVSKNTNVKVTYHNLSDVKGLAIGTVNSTSGTVTNVYTIDKNSINFIEAGFDTKIGSDLTLMGTFSKSNIDVGNVDNKGFYTQLTYKGADVKKEGSYDVYTSYRKVPVAAQLDSTWDYVKGMKGVQVGFDYVPATNIKVNAFYLDGKVINDIADGDDSKGKVYRAQVEFFF